MSNKENIRSYAASMGADVVGFSSKDRFDDGPDTHHPSALLKNAQTVIVYGRAIPKGILHSVEYGLYFLHRTYHSVYPFLDELGLALSKKIEEEGGLAVPIPSYAPLVYNDLEPWGILSLKHAAVFSGLGSFGRNELVFNPKYGSLLRFGAVVTDMEFEPDDMNYEDPCPPNCKACIKGCPNDAFTNGSFDKIKCMSNTIRHGIFPIALKDKAGLKNIELILNTVGYNYWIKCFECLRVCPLNRK